MVFRAAKVKSRYRRDQFFALSFKCEANARGHLLGTGYKMLTFAAVYLWLYLRCEFAELKFREQLRSTIACHEL